MMAIVIYQRLGIETNALMYTHIHIIQTNLVNVCVCVCVCVCVYLEAVCHVFVATASLTVKLWHAHGARAWVVCFP